MDKNILQLVALDQRESFEKKESFMARDVDRATIDSKQITVISGIRRSGKSTLLKQISASVQGYYYCNFEDERLLDFTHLDFQPLYEVFLETFGEQKVFFFDEIQNIAGWERFVRRLFGEGYKIFVTGSNAKLLSSELATSLTGRYLKLELYPFSFKEFLSFRQIPISRHWTTREKSMLARQFQDYCALGGFPGVIKSGNKDELIQLYQDILIKDLLVRFKIREVKAFRELAFYLISNIAAPMSFNNLKKLLGFKSVMTVKNYSDFLEEAYIFFSVSKFDYSVKKQIINDRKIYCIDTGLSGAVGFSFSENRGRVLENIVFLELKRRGKEVYYYHGNGECDFLLRHGSVITTAIQVTDGLSQENEKREVAGVLEAMDSHALKKGLILTLNQERDIVVGKSTVEVRPLLKWLLE